MNKALRQQVDKYLGKRYSFSANMQELFEVISGVYDQADAQRLTIEASRKLAQTEPPQDGDQHRQSVTESSKSKIAMLNLLEDLGLEKQNIEKTVQERTKELADERDRIRTLVEEMGEGVTALDKQGKIILWNKAASLLTGWEAEETINREFRGVLKFVLEKDHSEVPNIIALATKQSPDKRPASPLLLQRKDGTEMPIGISAAPLVDNNGKSFGAIIILRDTTMERKIERAKDQFVSLASHQLRTPLSIIKAYGEMLLDGDGGALTDDQTEYANEIVRANLRMIELVDRLLSVSRIELGIFSIDPELTDVIKLLDEEIKDFARILEEKQIKLHKIYPRDLPKMMVDSKLLSIVFENVISNACKYSLTGGTIDVELKSEPTGMQLMVADSGIGIPKAQQQYVFTKLFRADNARRTDTLGTGLGLYIAKSILGECGGKIWFESEENVGSKFYIFIPKAGMSPRVGAKGLF